MYISSNVGKDRDMVARWRCAEEGEGGRKVLIGCCGRRSILIGYCGGRRKGVKGFDLTHQKDTRQPMDTAYHPLETLPKEKT